jgi:ABC-2 type transport system ATP-binding protein
VQPIIDIQGLSKTYAGGFEALKSVDLSIRKGEIFALLGPNGAGKTTLIGIVCGLVKPTSGQVFADGWDIVRQPRQARAAIGLAPQELATDAFEKVWDTVSSPAGCSARPRTLATSRRC